MKSRLYKKILFTLFISLTIICFAHKFDGPGGHAYDFRSVIEGVKGKNLDELYKSISGGIDKEFYDIVRRELGAVKGNHRIIGHWGFEGSIPFEYEPWKSQLSHYSKPKLVELWRSYTQSLVNEAVLKTGLPAHQAKGLVGLLYNVHLLGDRVYGNVEVTQVIKPDLIIRDIEKNLHRLFGNNSSLVKNISAEISKIPKNAVYASKCDQVIKILYKHDIGEHFYSTYKGPLMRHGIQRVKTLKSQMLIRSQYASHKSYELGKQITKYIRGNNKSASPPLPKNGIITNGVLQELTVKNKKIIVLSVPVKNAISTGMQTGVMTFVFTEGYSIYKFAQGDISEERFIDESIKNCVSAMLVGGTTTFVTIALGATPSGWIILGIGIGTAVIADIAFEYLIKEFSTPELNMSDILGKLPSELQRRTTIWDDTGFECIFDYNSQRKSVFDDIDRVSIFDEIDRPSIFDEPTRHSIFD